MRHFPFVVVAAVLVSGPAWAQDGTPTNPIGLAAHDNSAKHYTRFDANDFTWNESTTHPATSPKKLMAIPDPDNAQALVMVDSGGGQLFELVAGQLTNWQSFKPTYTDQLGTTVSMDVKDAEYVPGIPNVMRPHIVCIGKVSGTALSKSCIAFFPVNPSNGTFAKVGGASADKYFFLSGDAIYDWYDVSFSRIDVGNDGSATNDLFIYWFIGVDGSGIGKVGYIKLTYSEVLNNGGVDPFDSSPGSVGGPPYALLNSTDLSPQITSGAFSLGTVSPEAHALELQPWVSPGGIAHCVIAYQDLGHSTPPTWAPHMKLVKWGPFDASPSEVDDQHTVTVSTASPWPIVRCRVKDNTAVVVSTIPTGTGSVVSEVFFADLNSAPPLQSGIGAASLAGGFNGLAWGYPTSGGKRLLYFGGYTNVSKIRVYEVKTDNWDSYSAHVNTGFATITLNSAQELMLINPPIRDNASAIVVLDEKVLNAFGFPGGSGGDTGDSGGGGGGCYVATAAYGSPLHPSVQALKGFRAEYLRTNAAGEVFSEAYELSAPNPAGLLERTGEARALARTALELASPAASGSGVLAVLAALSLALAFVRRFR